MKEIAMAVVIIPAVFFLIVWFLSAYVLYRIGKKFSVGSYGEYCIPFYNIYLLCKCAELPLWNFVGVFIPILNIYCIVNMWGVIAEKLGKSYWLYGIMCFLFGIPVLVLAFDDSYPFFDVKFDSINMPESAGMTEDVVRFQGEKIPAAAQEESPVEHVAAASPVEVESASQQVYEEPAEEDAILQEPDQGSKKTSGKNKKKFKLSFSRLPIIGSFAARQVTELVGVDIGTASIKICFLKNVKGFFTVQNVVFQTYEQDLLSDGHIVDVAFVGDELKRLFDENRIKSRNVACALSSYSVISKKILMPFLAEDELENTIGMEVENAIPFPLKDIYYSYYVMGTDFEKQNMLNVKIVAAKKEIVDAYIAAFNVAGLSLHILDVDVFGVSNIVEQIYSPKDFSVVVVDIGASVTNIAILNGENIEFTRELMMGGKYLTTLIQKSARLSFGDAEKKKLASDSNIAYLFEDFIFNIASEINKTVRFYLATKPKENIGKIFITGGSSLLAGLKEKIVEDTGIEAEVINPFLLVQAGEGGSEEYDALKEFMVVPLYLSTRVTDLS